MQPFYVEAGESLAFSCFFGTFIHWQESIAFCGRKFPEIFLFWSEVLFQQRCTATNAASSFPAGRCVVEGSSNHLFVDAPAVLGSTFFWQLCKVMSEKHMQSDDDAPMVQLYTMSSKMKSAFYVIRRDNLQAIMDMYPKEVATEFCSVTFSPFCSASTTAHSRLSLLGRCTLYVAAFTILKKTHAATLIFRQPSFIVLLLLRLLPHFVLISPPVFVHTLAARQFRCSFLAVMPTRIFSSYPARSP